MIAATVGLPVGPLTTGKRRCARISAQPARVLRVSMRARLYKEVQTLTRVPLRAVAAARVRRLGRRDALASARPIRTGVCSRCSVSSAC